jgi:hypothetical protein
MLKNSIVVVAIVAAWTVEEEPLKDLSNPVV